MLTLQDPTLLRSACYINGAWTLADSGDTVAVSNPATGAVIAHVPRCGAAHPTAAGVRCEREVDHQSKHRKGTLKWADPEPTPTEAAAVGAFGGYGLACLYALNKRRREAGALRIDGQARAAAACAVATAADPRLDHHAGAAFRLRRGRE